MPMSPTEQKSQERVRVELPIRVFGFDEARGRFNEDTNTIAVSPTGSLIALKHRVFPADVIRIVNLRNVQEADFRIVGPSAVGTTDVAEWGVECTERDRSIWGIAFPPLDPAAHVLLECLACRAQDSWPATLLEREVLDATGIMARSCSHCGKPTYWTYADASQRPEAFTQAQAVAPPPRVMPVKKAAERRNRKRLPMKLPIYVRSKKDKEEIGTTENLTTSGLAVALAMDLAEGEIVTIICPYTPGAQNIEQKAVVRWRDPYPAGPKRFYGLDYKL
jgi:hypothetical protein